MKVENYLFQNKKIDFICHKKSVNFSVGFIYYEQNSQDARRNGQELMEIYCIQLFALIEVRTFY